MKQILNSMLSSLNLCIGYYAATGKAYLKLVGGIKEGFLEEEMSINTGS